MKKIINILIATVLALFYTPSCIAYASVQPQISVMTTEAVVGETVEVAIEIAGNPGITALCFDVNYDTDKLSLTSAKDEKIFGDATATFGNDLTLVPYRMFWDDVATLDHTENGVVAVLEFEVLKEGFAEIELMLNENSTFNVAMENVYFATISGGVNCTADSTEITDPSNETYLKVETAETVVGETVEVAIEIAGNPGITALCFDVNYDTDKLSLISAKDEKIFGDATATFGNNLTLVPYRMFWDDATALDHTENGVIAILEFEVLKEGFAEINLILNENSTFNVAMDNVYFKTISGGVQIKENSIESSTTTSTVTTTATSTTETTTTTQVTDTQNTTLSTGTTTTDVSDADTTTTETTIVASPFELAKWAENDYYQKTGVESYRSDYVENSNGTLTITLYDEQGNILDTYTVHSKTGVGFNSNGDEVDLPQTGNNSLAPILIVLASLLFIILGAYAIKVSGVVDDKHRHEKG